MYEYHFVPSYKEFEVKSSNSGCYWWVLFPRNFHNTINWIIVASEEEADRAIRTLISLAALQIIQDPNPRVVIFN